MTDLSAVTSAADKARDWTRRRDLRVRAAISAGASLRAVGAAAGLSHTAVAKIVKRA